MTDTYDAVFDRLLQELADATDLPVEFFRTAPSSGDWLRARAAIIEAHMQLHRDRAERLVDAMQQSVAQVVELDWQASADLDLPPRRCQSEACDEYDGIHCYGDGCAMVRNVD